MPKACNLSSKVVAQVEQILEPYFTEFIEADEVIEGCVEYMIDTRKIQLVIENIRNERDSNA